MIIVDVTANYEYRVQLNAYRTIKSKDAIKAETHD